MGGCGKVKGVKRGRTGARAAGVGGGGGQAAAYRVLVCLGHKADHHRCALHTFSHAVVNVGLHPTINVHPVRRKWRWEERA
jgi:hypothetical protein